MTPRRLSTVVRLCSIPCGSLQAWNDFVRDACMHAILSGFRVGTSCINSLRGHLQYSELRAHTNIYKPLPNSTSAPKPGFSSTDPLARGVLSVKVLLATDVAGRGIDVKETQRDIMWCGRCLNALLKFASKTIQKEKKTPGESQSESETGETVRFTRRSTWW